MGMNSRRRSVSGGHLGLALMLLGGIWLLIAPVWVGFSHHRMASRIDEWAGAAVIFVSVVTFFLQWVFGLSDLVKSRVQRQQTDA
jgi:hypothetical protein